MCRSSGTRLTALWSGAAPFLGSRVDVEESFGSYRWADRIAYGGDDVQDSASSPRGKKPRAVPTGSNSRAWKPRVVAAAAASANDSRVRSVR